MPIKSSAAAAAAAATVLDSSKGESTIKEEENTQTNNKLEKHKIIYNKKAESEFFVDNSALAGFTGERILYMAIRELIENSLDSCESFSILPSINVSLKIHDQTNDLWLLSCEDNGTGISSEKLPVAVCSFLTSAKYMEKQQRGLFGVGLKMVAAFSTKDTDFPIRVWNKSIEESEEYFFELRTDIGTNKPIVLSKKILKNHDAHIKSTSGFKIEVILRAKLVPITKSKIYEYVSETSIVNPYASITFETDDGVFHFDRRTSIMPQPAQEILPHPSDMDLKTLKKAISKFQTQKISLPKILSSSFQKLSYEKAKDIVTNAGLTIKPITGNFSEHDLIKVVNICKKTRFQNPNTDHLSPIGEDVLTIGMMSEYTIVSGKGNDTVSNEKAGSQNPINKLEPEDAEAHVPTIPTEVQTDVTNYTLSNDERRRPPESQPQSLPQEKSSTTTKNSVSKSNFSVKVLKPVLTTYTSRTCVINNRPTIVETGLAYGGDIPSFKMYRFANKIPLLYDEGSDVAREVISEVEINKMGITKKQAKEQFSMNKESKKDRVIEVLPLHIFFHICSTKIPYKTAGKESIASEGELKYYMKSCLSELYRKLSTQIRKELKLKEAENKLRLYKHYLPFIVNSINESLGVKNSKLNDSFSVLIENHLSKKPLVDESDISASSLPEPSAMSTPPPPPSSSFASESKGSSTTSSSLASSSPATSSNPSSPPIESAPIGLHSPTSHEIKQQSAEVKRNPLLKVKEQEKENSISKYRIGNNNSIEKKKITPNSSRRSVKRNHSSAIIKNSKQNVKDEQHQHQQHMKKNKIILEKKSTTTPTPTTAATKKKNRSDGLKKGVKIKVQKLPNKIDKRRGIRSGAGAGAELRDATKIPSSSRLPQSKQIQSTIDSFSKRVNKGKRK